MSLYSQKRKMEGRGKTLRHGEPWTEQERRQLKEELERGHSITQIAHIHQRSSNAVIMMVSALERSERHVYKYGAAAVDIAEELTKLAHEDSKQTATHKWRLKNLATPEEGKTAPHPDARVNWMFCSGHADAIPAEPSDRRWFAITMEPEPVVIGGKYTGKRQGQADYSTGDYWEALAPIEGDNAKLQKALLSKDGPSLSYLWARITGALSVMELVTAELVLNGRHIHHPAFDFHQEPYTK